jgi:2-oxoisovalerate dehydrogenase E1 component alpha subunit
MRVQRVADRAPAYGIPGVSVDGNDVLATYDVVAAAAARARRGEGPTLIEARTYRLTPHTSDDDDRIYRSREEVEEWRKRDPIDRFRRYLEEHGVWDAAREAALQQQLHQQVDEAVEQAEHAPTPDRGSLRKHVYAEVTNASADIH